VRHGPNPLSNLRVVRGPDHDCLQPVPFANAKRVLLESVESAGTTVITAEDFEAMLEVDIAYSKWLDKHEADIS